MERTAPAEPVRAPAIRVGVGGWTYEPWRGSFFPPGLRRAEELSFASRHLTSLEVNGTFYRTQTPETFRKWAAETPEDFVFSVKGPRYVTNTASLAASGAGIARFFASGVTELGPKLGPILWQFGPNKRFSAEDFAAFLDLLPRESGGVPIRHAVEVRHQSFESPVFIDLLRAARIAVAYADSHEYPAIADVTGNFVYARLQRCSFDEPAGYADAALDAWAKRFRTWAAGGEPDDLPRLGSPVTDGMPRPCFVYFISGAKPRAPAAALALLARLEA